MAKVQAPLLSLGAKGQLGKTMVMSSWKGVKTARQYVVPANPKTDEQMVQRGFLADAVAFWKNALSGAALRKGWNVAAGVSGKAQSGFNAYTSEALAALVNQASGTIAATINVWSGNTPTGLKLVESMPAQELPWPASATAITKEGISLAITLGDLKGTGGTDQFNGTYALVKGAYVRVQIVHADGSYWASGVVETPTA
jgi:hypothetical protein